MKTTVLQIGIFTNVSHASPCLASRRNSIELCGLPTPRSVARISSLRAAIPFTLNADITNDCFITFSTPFGSALHSEVKKPSDKHRQSRITSENKTAWRPRVLFRNLRQCCQKFTPFSCKKGYQVLEFIANWRDFVPVFTKCKWWVGQFKTEVFW